MIKQKTKTVVKTVTINRVHCNDCDKVLHHTMACSVARCEICVNDLCEDCIGYEEGNTGDYRTVYCKSCWSIGEPYRNKIKELEDEIDRLNDEWISKTSKKE